VTADAAAWEDFLAMMGGRTLALWGTVLLAALAGTILLSLVRPWGRRVRDHGSGRAPPAR